jgi:hypothetical protein
MIASVRDPGGTVVLDDTEPGPGTADLSEAAWIQAFTAGEFGTTVISHGYTSSGWEAGPRSWMVALAEAIAAIAGRADILEYDSATGHFLPASAAPASIATGEKILLFNWADDSAVLYEGFSEAAADALFASLLLGERSGDFDIDQLHLIGHSRGTAINSEVAQRLTAVGRDVAHVTHLDPHDWGVLGGVSSDYDVNPGLDIAYPSGTTPNSGAVSWEGVSFADVYWQQNVAFLDAIPDPPRPGCAEFRIVPELNGRPVFGSYNEEWTCRPEPGNPGTNVTHSGVHEAYRETVFSGERTGFYYSRIGGGVSHRPDDNAADRIANNYDFETEGIVNGDFERGVITSDGTGSQPRPGWSIHGGGGVGGSLTEPYLILKDGQHWRAHNRFLIPIDATSIRYALRIEMASGGVAPSTDRLAVYINVEGGESVLVDELWLNQVQDWADRLIDVRPYRDEIVTLRFEVEPDGVLDSEVWVDNVSFTAPATSIAVDVEAFLQGPYAGSYQMAAELGEALPITQPYNVDPWGYPGSESVPADFFDTHPDIVDWVYLQLRSDPTTIVAEAAALLRNDGHVVSYADGLSPVEMDVPPGWYNVVLYHRNHLGVMSQASVDMTGVVGSYDFSLPGAAIGDEPVVDLGDGSGPLGLWAADANADGAVQALDFNEYINQTTTGAVGYRSADFNLDGAVQALDFNLYLASTLTGARSQVP